MADPITCTVKAVPADLLELAAQKAVEANALNAPSVHVLRAIAPGVKPTKLQIAAFTTKYWGPRGVNLTVGFLDGADSALRARILFHMNVWGRGANVRFRETATSPDVRIARLAGDGYGLVGGIGQYEHVWRMAYVRGPEGIIVSLAERIG